MYEYLRGSLASKSPSEAVVDCGGVGYLLKIPLSTYEALPAVGGQCRVLAYLHVREGIMALYGFATAEERTAFLKMLGISGVGPTAALSLLSGMPVAQLARAVADGDGGALKRVKGIGDKTAKRILLELKGVLDGFLEGAPAAKLPKQAEDAASALVNLGYSDKSAAAMIEKAMGELGPSAPVAEIIRLALARSG